MCCFDVWTNQTMLKSTYCNLHHHFVLLIMRLPMKGLAAGKGSAAVVAVCRFRRCLCEACLSRGWKKLNVETSSLANAS